MASQDHGIHSFEEFVPEGSDYFLQDSGKSAHKKKLDSYKRREDGSNWRSSSHDSKKIPQEVRNTKDSILEEPLIHLSIWIRNDVVMNEEDDEAEGSRRSLPTKRIKISIQFFISWYYFAMHLFIFSWFFMHDKMFSLMTTYY